MQKRGVKIGGLISSLTKRDSVTERIKPTAPNHSLSSTLSKPPSLPKIARRKASSGNQLKGYQCHCTMMSLFSKNQTTNQANQPHYSAFPKHLTLAQLQRATHTTEYSVLAVLVHVVLLCWSTNSLLDRLTAPTRKVWSKLPWLGTSTTIVCGVWVLLRSFGAAD